MSFANVGGYEFKTVQAVQTRLVASGGSDVQIMDDQLDLDVVPASLNSGMIVLDVEFGTEGGTLIAQPVQGLLQMYAADGVTILKNVYVASSLSGNNGPVKMSFSAYVPSPGCTFNLSANVVIGQTWGLSAIYTPPDPPIYTNLTGSVNAINTYSYSIIQFT